MAVTDNFSVPNVFGKMEKETIEQKYSEPLTNRLNTPQAREQSIVILITKDVKFTPHQSNLDKTFF